jgi:enamine deaminase RidA (YjgF/YER057c/UK114 family)
MVHQAVVPAGHSKPVGRYSPGVRVPLSQDAWLVFISGQVATDGSGQLIGPGDPGRQAEAVFGNIERVLNAAQGDLRHLVSLVIYLTDMAYFPAVSAVRNRLLGDPAPSSTLVSVASLAEPGVLVEISAVAVVPGSPG